MDEANKTQDPDEPGKPRRVWRRLGFVLVFVTLCLAGAYWALVGRNISAPNWMRASVELRLAEALPGFEVLFGDLQLRLEKDGRTHIILVDVDVQTTDGIPVAVLSDVEIGLAAYDLVRRKLSLRDLSVSGAFVTLKRDRTGRLGLALGDAFALGGDAPDMPTIVSQVDALLQDDRLKRLQTVEANALTLRFEDARARRGWTVDGGRLRLDRERDVLQLSGDFALLGGGATATTLQVNASSVIGDTEVDFGISLNDMPSQDIATQGPALAWLGALRAPISGALRATLLEDGSLGLLNATLQIDEGVLQPANDTPPVPFTAARSYFTFDPKAGRIEFTELSFDSALGRAVAEGAAHLKDLESGAPSEMIGQFQITRLEAAPDTLFPEPFEIDRAELDFRLRLQPFELTLGRLWIDDPSVPVRLSGRLSATEAAWDYALDGDFGELHSDALLRVWPSTLAAKPRLWVTRNLTGGIITEGSFAIRPRDGPEPLAYLNAAFKDAQVRYARTLPVIHEGRGTLNLNADRFTVRALGGHILPPQGGPIDIAGSTFVIPYTPKKPGDGELRLHGEGSIEALLSFLDSPPLSLMTKAKRSADMLEGRIAFSGALDLSLKKGTKFHEMTLDLQGRATDVASDVIIPNRSLTSRALDLSVTNDELMVEGLAEVSGVPFQGSWTMPIPPPDTPVPGSRVEGVVMLSEEAADAFGIDLPPGTLSGQGPADLTIDLVRGVPPAFELTSELEGLGVDIPPIGWSLPPNTSGNLRVAGRLEQPARVDVLSLSGPGLDADGSLGLNANGSLNAVEFSRVAAGNWLDAPVTLRGRGAGVPPAVVVNGGRVDVRNAPFGKTGGNTGTATATVPLTLALDTLQVSNSIRLTNFRGNLTSSGGLTGDFTASVNGKTPISGEAVAQNGQTSFRIRSNDAGKVIREAGILKTVAGGDMTLTLSPVAGRPGHYDGFVRVTNARMRNAPGIASLLDAISIVGLLDQLQGPGILFSEVEARFRLTPDRLFLTQSSAVGPSMGISLDGTYDLTSGTMDLQGVLSPIYFLNSIGSIFTRKGEGLIGFAFNLSGAASDPQVSVNPLSALTPGMFREIFRRPPPTPGQ